MPKATPTSRRTKKRTPAKAKSEKRPAATSKPAKPTTRKTPTAKAAEEFVRAVLARGEATKRVKKGSLPPGVTHEIVADDGKGLPKLRRRRFSLA